jgi:hypothetical protein
VPHSDRVCRTLFEPKRLTFPACSGVDGNQMIPVTAIISSANRAQDIFWRISTVNLPIRSWYVCLCVPGGVFR